MKAASDCCALAIASGARREEIVHILRHGNIEGSFSVIVAAEDVQFGKPHPEPFLRAFARLREKDTSLKMSECVAIEDSRWGLESARAAGLRAIGITHTYPSEALAGADLVIDHLDQLTPALLATLA